MEKGKGLALSTFKPGAFQPLSSHNNAHAIQAPEYKWEEYITAFWELSLIQRFSLPEPQIFHKN